MLSVIKTTRMVLHRHYAMTQQFFRFCLVGTLNTLLDFFVYVCLTRLFVWWNHYFVAAAVVSYGCGVVSSFILNNFWTFRQNRSGLPQRAPKFLVITTVGMFLNVLILHTLVSIGVYDLIAKIFATVCVIAWNFTLSKKWVFKV